MSKESVQQFYEGDLVETPGGDFRLVRTANDVEAGEYSPVTVTNTHGYISSYMPAQLKLVYPSKARGIDNEVSARRAMAPVITAAEQWARDDVSGMLLRRVAAVCLSDEEQDIANALGLTAAEYAEIKQDLRAEVA